MARVKVLVTSFMKTVVTLLCAVWSAVDALPSNKISLVPSIRAHKSCTGIRGLRGGTGELLTESSLYCLSGGLGVLKVQFIVFRLRV